MLSAPATTPRWQLYRLLSDPTRLRLLALAALEELSVSELADLLDEPQPNVSRHAAPLRQAGLLEDRRQGTRTFIHLSQSALQDPVIADAVQAGRRLCREEGSLERVAEVVARRDTKTREFFARPADTEPEAPSNLPAYLTAFAGFIADRELAVDVGTGEGVLLDILAPLYRRVIAIDRSEAQLVRARERARARGYLNVEFIEDQIDGELVARAVGKGASLVTASRVLHHAPRPRLALLEFANLARPGGRILVIDYARHEDEALRERQADVWMGFSEQELSDLAKQAGLVDVAVTALSPSLVRSGPDAHIGWLCLFASRPLTAARGSRKSSAAPARRDSNQKTETESTE